MLLGNPLLNDDRTLNTQAGLELSGPPVGLGTPLLNDDARGLMGLQPPVGLGNPLLNDDPRAPLGLQRPQGNLQSTEQFQQNINSILNPPAPAQPMPSQGQIFYSPSTGDIVVNGAEPFNEQNASAALASEQWANQPARRFTLPDTVSDWREMSREEYAAYLDGIRNPSFGRRISEANEHAWRGMGDIALGASLAVNPEWEWAQTARENLRQEFINDAPFLMRLQEVDSVEDGLTYAAQMAVQGVPWLVETLASMGVGALIGGAVSGGVGAPAGAVEGFLANQAIREATKRSIANVLRQNLARGARAYQQAAAARTVTQQAATALTREEVAEFAVRNSIASADDVNRFFNFGERAYHMARSEVGGSGFARNGALAAMFGSNYMTGVGDIRNSIEDAGGDPQSAEAIANIWGLALPYALIESLGDIIITQPLTNIGPNILNATARSGRFVDQAAARATNVARGMGIVGTAEGIEEGAQYIVTQQGVAGATNTPIDINPVDLLENVAGGFFAGAGLGGITYGLKRPDVSLEDGGLSVDGVQPETPGDGSLAPEGGASTLPFYGTQDTTVQGTDAPVPAYMGGLEPPDIDPAYGTTPPLDTAGMIGGRPVEQGPTAQEEREFLLRTLEDPNLTPEQYAATVQAIDALEGGRDSNMEAGDRYRAGANRGVLPDYGPMPEYQEPAPTDLGPAYQREVDPEALDSSMMEPGTAVSPEAIFQDMMDGKPVTPQQIDTLRKAVRELQRQNPTNPAYAEVIDAINRVEAEQSMDEYTEGTDAFKAKFPELTQYMETRELRGPQYTQSPMDAARPPAKAQPAKAKPIDNPIMEDGLPKYGPHRLKKPVGPDGLRNRTEEPATQPEPDLIEQAKTKGAQQAEQERAAAKKEKNRIKQREKRQKKAALKKSEKAAERDAKMREMAERTEEDKQKLADKRAMRPFGRDSRERQERYEAERRANEEATRESVLPEAKKDNRKAPLELFGVAHSGKTATHIAKILNMTTDNVQKLQELEEQALLGELVEADFILMNVLREQAGLRTVTREEWERIDQEANEYYLENDNEADEDTSVPEMARIRNSLDAGAKAEPKKRAAESDDLREAASIRAETKPVEATDARQEAAYKQGMRKYKDLYSLLQGARGKLGRSKKNSYEGKRDLPLSWTTATKWIEVDGVALSYNELEALIERVRAEYTATEKTERSATVFHDYVKDAWTQNKSDPKHFATFVEGNPDEVLNWLNSKVSELLPPARKAAQEILAKMGGKPVAAAVINSPRSLVMPDYARHIKARAFDAKNVKDTKVMLSGLIDAFSSWLDSLRTGKVKPNKWGQEGIRINIRRANTIIQEWEQLGLDRGVLAEFKALRDELSATLAEFSEKPVAAANTGRPPTVVTFILRRVLQEDPNFSFKPYSSSIAERKRLAEKARAVMDEINAAQRAAGEAESDITNLANRLTLLKQRLRKNDKPIAAANVEGRLPRRVIDVRTPDGPSQIIVNPTRADAMRMTRAPLGQDKFKYDMVRFIRDANGNVFAANGYYFIHDQIVEIVESKDINIVGYEKDEGVPNNGYGTRAIASAFFRDGDKIVFDEGDVVTEETLWPIKPVAASDEEIAARNGLVTHREVKDMVNGVQKRIAPGAKFKSTHVFTDVEDMLHRANNEILIAPNGAEVNLGRILMGMAIRKKMENPNVELSDLDWVRVVIAQDFDFRAGVLPAHDALIVFTNKLGNRRHALQTLEHEWIVHKGLRAIFPTEEARYEFLQRVSMIPGMDEKRKALLARKGAEIYRDLHILDQYEEVLAFHSEGGLLALEALLSGPETMNPETRMTLWEEFVSIVKEWLARVFGDTRTVTDQVLDEIVGALQRYAITGVPPGPTNIQAAAATGPSDTIIRAANLATPTPEETYELLHGTADSVNKPNRPYQERPWQKDLIDSVTSDKEIMAKLHDIGYGKVATPIKEGLKKLARELTTMVQMRLESPLIERMMEIMDETIKHARQLITSWNDARPYARLEAITDEWRARWGDKAPGSTELQRRSYSHMAIAATNHLLSKLSDAIVRAAPRLLVRHLDGTYTINYAVFEELLKQGTLSKEAFAKGLQQYTVDSEGEVTEAGVAKFTEEQIEAGYDIYLIETRLMAESALSKLEAITDMMSQKNNRAVAKIIRDNKFKESDQAFVNEALQRMYKLYTDIAFHDYGNKTVRQKATQADRARQVLAELMRTFHEEKKVKDWTDSRATRDDTAKSPRKNDAFKWREQVEPHEDVKPFVDQIRWFLEYDNTFGDSRLARINSLGVNDNRQYQMLGVFQSLLNSEVLAHEKENEVIHSILGNYVEMTRRGKWRVAFEIYEEDGKTRAEVSPVLLAKLPSFYVQSEREANAFQAEFGQEFGDKLYTVHNVDGDPVKVKFDVSVAMSPGQATMTDAPDIEGFLKVSELAGVKFGATEMKRITQLIANASTRKRYGLQRAGSPGMDADILRNNSETMTQRAWEAAKTSKSHMLEEEMSDEKLRYGDWERLDRLQNAFDLANTGLSTEDLLAGKAAPITFIRNEDAVINAELRLLRYANQLRHVARRSLKRPTVNVRTTRGEKKFKITGEAEAYITHAQSMRKSLDKNELELNLNDLLSKTGPLRQLSVVSTLGVAAAGFANAFTPITTLPPRLMAFHRDSGYGDGFGLSEVMSAIIEALSRVMTVFKGYGDTVMLKEILEQARKENTTGIPLPLLEAMYRETLNGKLTPQQTYSLTGGTESNVRNLWYRTISNVLLKPFSSVEAATRRVAFYASYTLLKKRFIAAGLGTEEQLNDHTSDQYKQLIKDIESVIDDTQGDYNNINRPRAFRGDMPQYVLQFKMFPLMVVFLINNLPMAQKAAVLGTLFLFSGLKGEPFADDFLDIYDTVMQKLGFQHDSLELSMVQFFEELLPGSSKWVMHGAIDAVAFGGTMSSRLGMGDILPLTGLFRPEADVGREVVNAFGPAFGSNIDYIEYASILTDYALEFSGMRPRTSSWEDLIRKFPQAQIRGIGEATIMAATGEISDPRGRLTSDEVNIYNIFTRALGFYPLESSKANDTVRLDRMHTGYMRNIRTRFVLAYARAYRADNEAEMERILDAVRDWNEAAELTGQEDMMIRNFRSAGVRAGRAASQTTVERTAASAPDYSLIEELAAATGADTETDE